MNYSYDYICEPRRITIIAKSVPTSSKGVNITFYVDNKEAYSIYSTLGTYTPTKVDVDNYVAMCCNRLKKLSEDKIQEVCDEDKIMLVLYVYKFLRKVEKKSGMCVWRL